MKTEHRSSRPEVGRRPPGGSPAGVRAMSGSGRSSVSQGMIRTKRDAKPAMPAAPTPLRDEELAVVSGAGKSKGSTKPQQTYYTVTLKECFVTGISL
jgi:hypothetical protein